MPMTTSNEAQPALHQHTRPCHDCPWRRESLPGWLGGHSIEEWQQRAHSETLVECHVYDGPQCAGIATYRANVLKKSRYPEILMLPADRDEVFATPGEFATHHDVFSKDK